MTDPTLLASFVAGGICVEAGLLSYFRSPSSTAARFFLMAMIATFVGTVMGSSNVILDQNQVDAPNVLAKSFVASSLLAIAFLFEVALVFPVNQQIMFQPMNSRGAATIGVTASAVAIGITAESDFNSSIGLTNITSALMIAYIIFITVTTGALLLNARPRADNSGRRSATMFLAGLLVFAGSGIMASMNLFLTDDSSRGYGTALGVSTLAGVALGGIIFTIAIVGGKLTMSAAPVAEKLTSSSKSRFKLEQRRVYLVEEPKPVFSMKIFTDILKGRCYDCEDDESFACESLECSSCKLPCPCRQCTKKRSRTQGLIVTRSYPKDVREKHFLQTTPVIWLSTVAGSDSTDPAKLAVLSDYLVNFMEKSHNGVVYVDGIEYLMTTNDFPKVLKAIDRWTETAMTTASSLILSFDPRAFDLKEVALLERNREVVKPEANTKHLSGPLARA